MKIFFALVAVAWAIPHPITIDQEWNEYKKTFGKFYTSEGEDARRLNAYLAAKQRVEEHNRKYERGESRYAMEINKFADWFPEELDMLNGLKIDRRERSEETKAFELPPGVAVPDEVNWVKRGAVTGVKNQGNCGSCYAFSAVGALEGLMYTTNKTITDLSPQELVDCSEKNFGCNGGLIDLCFEYVMTRKGISTEASYPYEAARGRCRADRGRVGADCTDYRDIMGNEDAMKSVVGAIGPVSFAFAVSNDFFFYKEGIFDGTCDINPNHAMLIVGYGKDEETVKDYWLVKNSWGPNWGMDGYVKIVRNEDKCDINSARSYPVYVKCSPHHN